MFVCICPSRTSLQGFSLGSSLLRFMCGAHAGHEDGTDEIVGPFDLGVGIEGPWVAPIFTAGAFSNRPRHSILRSPHTRHCLLAKPQILTSTQPSLNAIVRARLAPLTSTHSPGPLPPHGCCFHRNRAIVRHCGERKACSPYIHRQPPNHDGGGIAVS